MIRNAIFSIVESTVLVKTFSLLEALSAGHDAQPLGVLVERTGLTPPTVHRLLKSLTGLGYVDRVGEGSYRLTDRLRKLAMPAEDDGLAAVSRAALEKLRRRSGETVNLGVLRGDRVEYLLVLESAHPLRRVAESGGTDPFHCTALGRVLAAYLPPVQRRKLVQSAPLPRRTRRTLTNRKALLAAIESARADGCAVERDQTDLGVTCVAAPIFRHGDAIAAVSISAASARVDEAVEHRFRAAAVRAAAEVTSLLSNERSSSRGHHPAHDSRAPVQRRGQRRTG